MHPTDSTLEAWVAGELAPDELGTVAQHVDTCDRCAERLTTLARQELAFRAVAEASIAQRSTAAPRRSRWPLLAVAAAAVAMLAVGLAGRTDGDEQGQTRDVAPDCLGRPDVDACRGEAAGRGLHVPGAAVPHYDAQRLGMDAGRSG